MGLRFKIKKDKKYNYYEEGEGHPIVFLHGLMGGLGNFNHQIHFFSENGFKVFVPSLPLYSMNILYSNVKNLSRFVYRFLNDIVKQPATLVGNSLGGHLGLVVALNHPEMVHSLVLTGSSGLYEKPFGESFPKRGDYEYVKQKSESVFYDPATATKEIVDDVYAILNDRKKAMKTLYIARSAIKHNMQKDLPNIKTPVCLIWGKQDNVTPPEVAEDFHKYLPNSDLFWVDKCGHSPMMERPEIFNQILLEWLRKKL